jgi:lysophospholipase L1-like esterase
MHRSAAIIFLAVALTACGPKTKVEKLDSAAVILAFGDSLTFGTGASPSESYPAALGRSIGRKVVNAGVPGETSERGLERLPDVLEEVKPRLLILCHGGNDFLQRLDEGKARENVRAMIALARSKGIAVVLIGTPKPGLPPSVPAFYGEIAAEFKIPFDDGALRSVLIDKELKADMVHPNAAGYAQVAATVEKLLKKSGAI